MQVAKRWSTSLGLWGVGAGTAALFVRESVQYALPPMSIIPLTHEPAVALRHTAREKGVPRQSPCGKCRHPLAHVRPGNRWLTCPL